MNNPSSQKLNLALDFRIVSVVLLIVIGVMLVIWKPWSAPANSGRTVEVTGESKVTATPDEFVFHPTYQVQNADKDVALAELSQKSKEVTAKLKSLGVPDNKIRTNTDGYDKALYDGSNETPTYMLYFTITVSSADMSQKVQDYLVTTAPTGSISPQATFSDAKRKELETKARTEATKDARKKADQMADNLGFKVGKIKQLSDGSGFDAMPFAAERDAASSLAVDMPTTTPSLPVQPGENDLRYSVTVTYFIK